jgi:hypothetical protein
VVKLVSTSCAIFSSHFKKNKFNSDSVNSFSLDFFLFWK